MKYNILQYLNKHILNLRKTVQLFVVFCAILFNINVSAIGTPTLSYPYNGITLTVTSTYNLCFSWYALAGADDYSLQISTSGDFSVDRWQKRPISGSATSACWNSGAGFESKGSSPIPVPSSIPVGTTIYWRLNAWDRDTNPDTLVHSQERSINTIWGTPVMSAPAVPVSSLAGGYSVTWSPGTYETNSYKLLRRKIGSAWQYVYTGTALSYTESSFAFPQWGDYQYTLIGCNPGKCGYIGAISSAVEIGIPKPAAPPIGLTLHNAYEDVTPKTMMLQWQKPSGVVDRYLIQQCDRTVNNAVCSGSAVTDHSVSYQSVNHSFVNHAVVFEPPTTMYEAGRYEYRVKACNTTFTHCSGYSFWLQIEPFAPYTPNPYISNNSVPGTFSLNWTNYGPLIERFEIVEMKDGAPDTTTTIEDKNQTSLAFTDKTGLVIRFKIRACNSFGCSIYSPEVSAVGIPSPVVYKYDARGRLKEVSDENGKKITYTYDDAGNRKEVIVVPPS